MIAVPNLEPAQGMHYPSEHHSGTAQSREPDQENGVYHFPKQHYT
jgi:hypothetical protein